MAEVNFEANVFARNEAISQRDYFVPRNDAQCLVCLLITFYFFTFEIKKIMVLLIDIENSKHELVVSDWHKEVLDERIENKTVDTSKLKTWGALKLELTQKHNL